MIVSSGSCRVKNEVTHVAMCVRCDAMRACERLASRGYGPRFSDILGDGRQLRLAPALLPSLA